MCEVEEVLNLTGKETVRGWLIINRLEVTGIANGRLFRVDWRPRLWEWKEGLERNTSGIGN